MSLFKDVPQAPPDAIFGVKTKHDASPLPSKFLLSVGVYRTEEGKPYVFKAVQKAEDRILHNHNKEYLPMGGLPAFVEGARKLLFGPVLPEVADRVASVQSCAGTGALMTVAHFCQHKMKFPKVLVSKQTWPNHRAIFQDFDLGDYPWAKNCRFDPEGCLGALNEAPDGSLIVLQAVAHNPTGIDPTHEQWQEIFKVVDQKKHTICFDFAYMGFGSGDMDKDAEIIREYAKTGKEFFVCFSFSKCMGLYGERIGCLHAVCANADDAKRVGSQLAVSVRQTISNCPMNGAYIAAEILNDPALTAEWKEELKEVTHRIIDIRGKFVKSLEEKTGKDWSFIAEQRGMFALTGLTPEQVDKLGNEQGVFIPQNGRISVPALNNSNYEAVAQAVANVVNGK